MGENVAADGEDDAKMQTKWEEMKYKCKERALERGKLNRFCHGNCGKSHSLVLSISFRFNSRIVQLWIERIHVRLRCDSLNWCSKCVHFDIPGNARRYWWRCTFVAISRLSFSLSPPSLLVGGEWSRIFSGVNKKEFLRKEIEIGWEGKGRRKKVTQMHLSYLFYPRILCDVFRIKTNI